MSTKEPDPATGQPDDVRRKFREALERKQGRAGGASAGAGQQPGGQHPHTSAAKPQRTFRRKSG